MKKHTTFLFHILLPVFLGFSQISLIAQTETPPINFEFLDARGTVPEILESQRVENGILYVSGQPEANPGIGGYAGVTVNLATYENELINIFNGWFRPSTKKVWLNDSTFQIFLYNFTSVSSISFISITSQVSTIKVDTIYSKFETMGLSIGNPTLDVVPLNEGGWLALDHYYGATSLVTYNSEGELISCVDSSPELNLYSSVSGSFVSTATTISELDGDLVTEVLSFSEEILEMCHHPLGNFILFNEKLLLYNPDFSILEKEWEIPEQITSFKQLEIQSLEAVYGMMVEEEGNSITFVKIESDQVLNLYSSSALEENEIYNGFHFINENYFLVEGLLRWDEFSFPSQTPFFRSLPNGIEVEYEKVDISVEEFTVVEIEQDYINPEDPLRYYTYSIRLKNSGAETISRVIAFSTEYTGWGSTLKFYFEEEIVPNGIVETSGGFESYGISPTFKLLALSGDFRFNNSINNSLLVDLIINVEELSPEPNPSLKIYPNPASNYLQFDFETESKVEQIAIYNLQGQLVLQQYSKIGIEQIDISKLKPSEYIIKLNNTTNPNQSTNWARFTKL